MKDNVRLQASDPISWHDRHGNEIRKGFRNGPIHRATPVLIRADGVFGYVPNEEFRAQVAELFKSCSAEWSQQVWTQMVEREQRRQEQRRREQERRDGSEALPGSRLIARK